MIGLQLVEIINGTTESTAPRTGTACHCLTAVAVALDGRTKGLAESRSMALDDAIVCCRPGD
jgi:hypothetical protein